MTVSARMVADDVWASITAMPNLATYRNEIVDADGNPVDPPVDPDGRVHGYAVAYFDAGTPYRDRKTASTSHTQFTCQISCVGGDDTRALWAVDKITTALDDLRLHGGQLVRFSTTMRVDDNIQPPRTVRDLFYRLQART